jgi:hypothetical protein
MRYEPGFLRNVAVAMGNAGLDEFRAPLKRLAQSADSLAAETRPLGAGALRRGPLAPQNEHCQ